MLPCISTPWARTKCVSAFWAQSGARHFSCKFPYQVALVKCWLAFRLRRLVQGLRCGFGAQHFSCKFPYDVALVKCYLAFRLRGLAQSVCLHSGLNPGHGICLVSFHIKWLLWNVDLHGALQRSCQETSYRDLVQGYYQGTFSCGDLVQRHCIEILLQRSCHEALYRSYRDVANRAPIEILHRDLKKRYCQEISFGDLVQEVLPRHLF